MRTRLFSFFFSYGRKAAHSIKWQLKKDHRDKKQNRHWHRPGTSLGTLICINVCFLPLIHKAYVKPWKIRLWIKGSERVMSLVGVTVVLWMFSSLFLLVSLLVVFVQICGFISRRLSVWFKCVGHLRYESLLRSPPRYSCFPRKEIRGSIRTSTSGTLAVPWHSILWEVCFSERQSSHMGRCMRR